MTTTGKTLAILGIAAFSFAVLPAFDSAQAQGNPQAARARCFEQAKQQWPGTNPEAGTQRAAFYKACAVKAGVRP